jgi:hypothetical protein
LPATVALRLRIFGPVRQCGGIRAAGAVDVNESESYERGVDLLERVVAMLTKLID